MRVAAEDVTNNKPIDLDEVTARLLDLPTTSTTADLPTSTAAEPRFPPPLFYPRSSRTPTPPPPRDEDCEKDCYERLVNDGGRPCYPIDLLEEVASNPVAYNEKLRPWQPYPDPQSTEWEVFGEQYGSWMMFREWQKYHRRDQSYSRDQFFAEVSHAYTSFRRRFQPEPGGLPEYTEGVKSLLSQHGFTREFRFQEDPMQQDPLTTWIEYYGYECSQYNRYARIVDRLQPTFDDASKKLMNSKMLRPTETQESIRDTTTAFERQADKNEAWRSLEAAKAAAREALARAEKNGNNMQGLHLTPGEQEQMMTATPRLDEAKAAYESVVERNGAISAFIEATRDYDDTKRKVKWYEFLLQWILDELHEIEAEMSKHTVTNTGPKALRRSMRKSAHDASEAIAECLTVKRPKKLGAQAYKAGGSHKNKRQARKGSRWSRRLAGLSPECEDCV